jgi:NADH:ubiquinone oxidoreductase subunit
MTIGTRLYTWLRGEEVGRDEFGNRYYRDKTGERRARREKRWVVYEGEAEATKVPPDWHAWLHHLIAAPPPPGGLPTRKAWQKPHLPNQTGTPNAYRPPGHELRGGKRDKATGDYEPWTPN